MTVNELAQLLAPIGCGPHELQSTIVYPDLGLPHRVGLVRPLGSPLSLSEALVCC